MYHMVADNEASWLGQLRRGVADRCVLALLEHEERYGFDLAKTLAHARLIAGEGTIYPLLSRLRRDGLVETVWRESVEGPPRRYYTLTPAGAEALAQFRWQWRQLTAAVDQLVGDGKEVSSE
jgi:PadR family transcriptional regulator PadR